MFLPARRAIFLVCFILVTGNLAPTSFARDRLEARKPAPMPRVSAARIRADVEHLAAPALKGRGLGMPELDQAADYLAQKLKVAGLAGGAADGSYFQPFEIATDVTLSPGNRLELGTPASRSAVALDEGFRPMGFSDSSRVEGPVVFAGYGITAPDLKYDDYAGIEVKDRVVLVLRGIPTGAPAGAFKVAGAERFGQLRYKALTAREHGARAILFVDREPGGDLMPLPKGQVISSAGIVAVHLKREVADKLLVAPTGTSLDVLQKEIDTALAPSSRALGEVTARLEVGLEKKTGTARNVIGRLEGSDPKLKEEAIVIGAHYDHLGLGGESSLAPDRLGQAHPGADDNASGTAAVLELARYFAKAPRQPRTLLFALFTAEEVGLGGSSHYVRSPVVPLEQTILMVNLDMVGRLRDGKLYVQGVDTAEGLRELAETAAKSWKLQPSFSGDGYGPSDHTPFYARDIPVLFFFTGAHADYHRPSDTADKINADGIATVVEVVARVTMQVAKAESRPKYVRLSSAPPLDPTGGGGRGYGAYLGTIPDFSEGDGKGVLLTGVRPGSPAEQAGIKGGDVLIRIGGRDIQNLQDFTYILQSHKPGDTVEIVVRRDGREVTVQATLAKRQQR